jgi:hypothetical protein
VGVKKLTTPLTLTLSCKRRGKKRKGFNGTPHFNSLPQGERRKKDERKRITLMTPLTFVLSRKWREGRKENDFNGTFHFNYFSLGEKGKES